MRCSHEGWSRLVDTLRDKPQIGHYVRNLHIQGAHHAFGLLQYLPRLCSLTVLACPADPPKDYLANWLPEPLTALTYLSITFNHSQDLKVLLRTAPSLKNLYVVYRGCAEDGDEAWQDWNAPPLELTLFCVDAAKDNPPSALFLRKLTESTAQTLQELVVKVEFKRQGYDYQSETCWYASWLPKCLPNIRWLTLRRMTCRSCDVFLASASVKLEHLSLTALLDMSRTWLERLPGSLQSLELMSTDSFVSSMAVGVLALLEEPTIWLPKLLNAPFVDVDLEGSEVFTIEGRVIDQKDAYCRAMERFRERLREAYGKRQAGLPRGPAD
ncbi:hypothetical protein EMMF5_002271 [Cystobasidiomycetes sp. EMM_F5]